MRLLISFLLAWPRLTKAVVRIGAVGLLFYAASFYTRDWRTVVAQADQPVAAQAAARSKVVPRPLPSKLAALPDPVEPTTTGALARMTPAAPSSAVEAVTRRPTPAQPRLQERSAAPRSPKHHRPSRGTQVAARPPAAEPTPAPPTPSLLERMFQARLSERGA